MTILEILNSRAKDKEISIGIGLGDNQEHNIKLLNASEKFLQENKSKIFLFGDKDLISYLTENPKYKLLKSHIILIESSKPETDIIRFLTNGMINAVVRGNLSSRKFLDNLKKSLSIKVTRRLALLETYKGYQFFFGPVGIDESRDVESKILFIEEAIKQFELMQLKPKVSVLSGGRIDDIGRDTFVDRSMNTAEEIVNYFKRENSNLEINHSEILIEDAIRNKSNLIIAPDGISGNLIYRTLVHLGGGKAYGAIYMGIDHIIIDTSRVGSQYEIYGALILCLALAP